MKTRNNLKRKIIIIGARIDGHAGVILDTIEEIGEYEVVGFVDNSPRLQKKNFKGIPVIGSTDQLNSLKVPTKYFHIAIGENISRYNIFKLLKSRNFNVETIVHPSATVSKYSTLGEGCFIAPHAVVNNGSNIGNVTIINTGAIVEHNSQVGDAVHLAPGVKTAGRVKIGKFSFIGLGATILPDIHVGSGVMVGAGSTVVKNVAPNTTMIGYAARKRTSNIYMDTKSDVLQPEKIYVAQPTLPEYPLLDEKFRDIARSLVLSNFAQYSNKLEIEVANILEVKRALSFPNATSSLMLALKALDLKGEVILPSYTFSATGHAVVWNGLTPVFADINPRTFNIDPDDVERKITKKTSAILGVHIFGNPCDISRLETIARKNKLKLIFDSAHALGSMYNGRMIGSFGDVECFSLSGTKVITSAEGGIITSDNEVLIRKLDIGRNYGAVDDYDCQYIGLNGKMSEFHAAIALESLPLMDKFVKKRNELAGLYKKRLSEIPGISFQSQDSRDVSTFKDFGVIINKNIFGMDRDELIARLSREGIFAKKYFFPIHMMKAYGNIKCQKKNLTHTEFVANSIVCLPIYSHMTEEMLDKICYAVFRIRESVIKK